MKKYKEKNGNNAYLTKFNNYYTINYKFHGLYAYITFKEDNKKFKGFYNMDMEYSHWLENHNEFKYYL